MFDLGMQELIVIFIVALLVFGPKRLPELGRTIGKGILELKRAMQGVKEQIDLEIDSTPSHRDSITPVSIPEKEDKGDKVTDYKETEEEKEKKND
jgi:sec-independent protein translocase protein TatB